MTFWGPWTTGTTRCGRALYCIAGVDDLGPDQYHEPESPGGNLVEGGDDGIDAMTDLPGAWCCRRDEAVRHFCEVRK